MKIFTARTRPRLRLRGKMAADMAEQRHIKVVLAGNPNAGKTTLFNALTKSRLKTGNWHGVTTRPAYKTVGGVTYADVPGMYSFSGYSMEEASAAEEIKAADIVVNVVDSLSLENSLNLTRAITDMNACTIVYVTKLRQLKRRGGRLDKGALSAMLGVPVVSDIKQLKNALAQAGHYGFSGAGRPPQKIALNRAYYAGNCALSRAEKLFYNRYFALVFFIAAILAMFFVAFFPGMPGDALKSLTERLITVRLGGAVGAALPEGKVRSLVCDGIIGGAGGVLSFVPQLAVLYLFLTVLDESGIMSALSFVTDGLFLKVRLSGRAAFSLVSGFGCTAAAILTTRGLTSASAQRRTVAVLAYIPCGAKMPVFLTLLSPLFSNPFPAISALYFGGIAISLVACRLMGRGGEELLSEVTPIALPQPSAVAKKLYFYIKGFIIKVATSVMLFCVISWVLSNFTFAFRPCGLQDSMLACVCRAVLPVFAPMGIADWRLAYAFVSGFAAKENVAATIAMLMPQGAGLNVASGVAASVFILTCPACISAFSASVREVGLKFTLKYTAVQLLFCFLAAYAAYFALSLFLL